MQNPAQRNEFLENFFKNIFNIDSPDKLKSLLAKATADPRNITDLDIYITNNMRFFSTISSQAVLVPNEFAIDHDESSGCDA